jgi:hypothetical protein
MDSFLSVLSLGYYQLKQTIKKEKIHINCAFAAPINRNGDILLSSENNENNLDTLLFNSYNSSSCKKENT